MFSRLEKLEQHRPAGGGQVPLGRSPFLHPSTLGRKSAFLNVSLYCAGYLQSVHCPGLFVTVAHAAVT